MKGQIEELVKLGVGPIELGIKVLIETNFSKTGNVLYYSSILKEQPLNVYRYL